MAFSNAKLGTMLFTIDKVLKRSKKKYPKYAARLKERNLIAQIKTKDDAAGRWFQFKNGDITSFKGIHPNPDASMVFHTAEDAVRLLMPPRDQMAMINAGKSGQVVFQGADDATMWFSETLFMALSVGTPYGKDMGHGVMRYTSNTNGGPVFVYVKNDKIIRITPIEFDDSDAGPWTIKARGKSFTPPRHTTISPYTLAWKSMIYSKDRLLYPMKRVDFDPDGNRNEKNRGVSGYERISWDQALDIVAGEIKRVKRDHGPGAILNGSGSHHTWGNIGYWLSARLRFFNSIGFTPVVHNPDSWEGWYWGAMHHWGNSVRLGLPEGYGTIEDCMQNCQMVVFWSSDPESTSGAYGAFEGTVRRQWLKELGIELVHIDPYYNHTAALLGGKWLAPRPATGNSLALAIAYVWITEALYDQQYVADRTVGFDQWKDYVLGKEDGIPKTPEWQEGESAIPAKDVRALARQWGSQKTYLAAGGLNGLGSACRCATGIEWARSMVYLMAMQGLGKPGVNMGCMQQGGTCGSLVLFPRLCRGRFFRRSEQYGLGCELVSANATDTFHEYRKPVSATAQDSRSHFRRQM